MRRNLIVLSSFLFLTTGLHAGDAPVPPELRQRVEALVEALSSGDPVRYEKLAQEHFAPALLERRTAEERRQFLARFHGDFGKVALVALTATGPWTAEATLQGGGLTATLPLELEAEPPHRISSFEVRVSPGGHDEAKSVLPPPPALRDAKTGPVLAAALDPYLQGIAAGGAFSGVVLVALEGNPLYTRAFGVANQEKGTANTPATRFDIASIGKHFTHVAVGQLLAQGKLALDDTVGKHLPRYPNADAAGKVTIQHLLGHRGGVVDIFAVAIPGGAPASNREWFDLVAPRPLEFEPGTEMRYCNGCYVVLGEIVAALSGMPYERYLAEKVFAPAGMTATAFLDGSAPGAEQAVSYARSAQGLRATSIGPGGRGNGAGGVFSTAADLLAYENALRGYRLLDRERTGWILGGETTAARASGRLGVAGGGEGTNAALIGDGTWTVIVLTNRDPRTGVDLARALAKALGG